jgi:hypothetical protein
VHNKPAERAAPELSTFNQTARTVGYQRPVNVSFSNTVRNLTFVWAVFSDAMPDHIPSNGRTAVA